MLNRNIIILCGVLWLGASAKVLGDNPVDRLDIYAETYPPFSYLENNIPAGFSVDIFAEMLKISGSSQSRSDISIVPWARGYAALERGPNVLLFSTTRTSVRENLFKWVCPIAPYVRVLVAPKGSGVKIHGVEDLKNYVYSVVRNDNSVQVLRSLAVPEENMYYVDKAIMAARMMVYKRLHVWATAKHTYAQMLQEIGADPADYEIVYEFAPQSLCFAFSKDTDDVTIGKLQAALNEVRNNGTFNKICAKYGMRKFSVGTVATE